MPKHEIDDVAAALDAMSRGETPGMVPAEEARAAGLVDGVDEMLSTQLSFFGGMGDATGIRVTPEVAMTASAVYACINVLATAIGSLPVHVVDRESGGHRTDHPVQELLENPNDYMTPAEFWEAFVVNLCGWGNGYAAAPRDRVTFRVKELLPLRASDTEPRRKRGRLFYATQLGAGDASALRAENVLHVKNMSFGGLIGISPVQAASRTLGVSVALEEFAAKFFKNGANIQHILELPKMKQDQLEEFNRRWAKKYAGIENSHRTAAVPEIKVHRVGSTPEEAQALESRVHQIREACRIYRVPPHMVYDLERATFSNIEEQGRDFAQNSLRPWIVKIEQALDRLVFRKDERRQYAVRFNLDAVIRASTKDRYEALVKAVGGPIMTADEARALEGLPAAPGGSKLLTPLNTIPAEKRDAVVAVLRGDDSAPKQTTDSGGSIKVRKVMTTAVGQVIRKEINAVKRAAKKHAGDAEAFNAWATGFYSAEHGQRLARSLGMSDDQADDAGGIVGEYLQHTPTEIRIAFEKGTIPELLDRWETRPGKLVARALGDPPETIPATQ